MNTVTVVGRVGRDASEGFKAFDSGKMKANFSVAVNRPIANADGTRTADFINCVAWRGTAEFIAKYFKKGSAVSISVLSFHKYASIIKHRQYCHSTHMQAQLSCCKLAVWKLYCIFNNL